MAELSILSEGEASGSKCNSPVKDGSKDKLFDPTVNMLVHDFDDEQTLEEEEALAARESEDPQDELKTLQQESDMPLEDLLALYGYGNQQDKDTSVSEQESESQDVPLPCEEVVTDEKESSKLHKIYDPPYETGQELVEGPVILHSASRGQSEEEDDDVDYCPDEEEWKKQVMVGPQYQAVVPEAMKPYSGKLALPYENEDKLLWNPSPLREEEIEHFLLRVYNVDVCTDDLPVNFILKDDEQLLFQLQQCEHDVEETIRRRSVTWIPSSDTLTLWSDEESSNFELGLKEYGKDFFRIHQNRVRTRSVSELVHYYYLWKKTEQHDTFVKQIRETNKVLKSGTSDVSKISDNMSTVESTPVLPPSKTVSKSKSDQTSVPAQIVLTTLSEPSESLLTNTPVSDSEVRKIITKNDNPLSSPLKDIHSARLDKKTTTIKKRKRPTTAVARKLILEPSDFAISLLDFNTPEHKSKNPTVSEQTEISNEANSRVLEKLGDSNISTKSEPLNPVSKSVISAIEELCKQKLTAMKRKKCSSESEYCDNMGSNSGPDNAKKKLALAEQMETKDLISSRVPGKQDENDVGVKPIPVSPLSNSRPDIAEEISKQQVMPIVQKKYISESEHWASVWPDILPVYENKTIVEQVKTKNEISLIVPDKQDNNDICTKPKADSPSDSAKLEAIREFCKKLEMPDKQIKCTTLTLESSQEDNNKNSISTERLATKNLVVAGKQEEKDISMKIEQECVITASDESGEPLGKKPIIVSSNCKTQINNTNLMKNVTQNLEKIQDNENNENSQDIINSQISVNSEENMCSQYKESTYTDNCSLNVQLSQNNFHNTDNADVNAQCNQNSTLCTSSSRISSETGSFMTAPLSFSEAEIDKFPYPEPSSTYNSDQQSSETTKIEPQSSPSKSQTLFNPTS